MDSQKGSAQFTIRLSPQDSALSAEEKLQLQSIQARDNKIPESGVNSAEELLQLEAMRDKIPESDAKPLPREDS